MFPLWVDSLVYQENLFAYFFWKNYPWAFLLNPSPIHVEMIFPSFAIPTYSNMYLLPLQHRFADNQENGLIIFTSQNLAHFLHKLRAQQIFGKHVNAFEEEGSCNSIISSTSFHLKIRKFQIKMQIILLMDYIKILEGKIPKDFLHRD